MRLKFRRVALVSAVVAVLAGCGGLTDNIDEISVCEDLDSGVRLGDGSESVMLEAPDGFLISYYCLKGRGGVERDVSDVQYFEVDDPVASMEVRLPTEGMMITQYSFSVKAAQYDTCNALESGVIEGPNKSSLVIEAPEGRLVLNYCLQDAGEQVVQYFEVFLPAASIEVELPGNAVIGHYSYNTMADPSVPDSTVPDSTVPDSTVPDSTIPATTNPDNIGPIDSTIPDTTIPDTTVPDSTIPDTTVPDTTVPDSTIPDTTIPDSTIPDTTIPVTTVPDPDNIGPIDSTIPDTTIPETTIPDSTIPATTIPDSTAPTTTIGNEAGQTTTTAPAGDLTGTTIPATSAPIRPPPLENEPDAEIPTVTLGSLPGTPTLPNLDGPGSAGETGQLDDNSSINDSSKVSASSNSSLVFNVTFFVASLVIFGALAAWVITRRENNKKQSEK